jgi:hypothetical protein
MGDILGGGNIFSAARYEGIRENLTYVKVGELCDETGILSREQVADRIRIPLTAVEYGKLRDSLKYLIRKYKPVWEMREKGKNIAEWIAPIKKGSGKFRGIMSGRGSRVYRKFSFDNIRPINSLWGQLELEKDEILLSCCMVLWNIREMDTELRQFIFRWHQGMIHGNTVISHFGEVDRKCSFCKIVARNELVQVLGRDLNQQEEEGLNAGDENRKHIYWECEHVQKCIRDVHENIWEVGTAVGKKEFLMGRNMGTKEATLLYMMTNMYIKFRIWKYKLAGILPKVQCITNDVRNWITNISVYHKWRIMLPLVRQQLRM